MDFAESQIRTTANLLIYPDSFLRDQNWLFKEVFFKSCNQTDVNTYPILHYFQEIENYKKSLLLFFSPKRNYLAWLRTMFGFRSLTA